ncbi:MAG TPA: helix-turn-helix transcriptional regulator [Gammaproteobacteria bacterium]|nr:helix-turn-helix transcriptional regulator [Gammaproteobacteria bacterium]
MPTPAELLTAARQRAALSQRALAAKAGTAQSVVARIESGETSPSWGTLATLLSAAGVQMRVELEPVSAYRSHMLDDVPRILRLTPEERLIELRNAARLIANARPRNE